MLVTRGNKCKRSGCWPVKRPPSNHSCTKESPWILVEFSWTQHACRLAALSQEAYTRVGGENKLFKSCNIRASRREAYSSNANCKYFMTRVSLKEHRAQRIRAILGELEAKRVCVLKSLDKAKAVYVLKNLSLMPSLVHRFAQPLMVKRLSPAIRVRLRPACLTMSNKSGFSKSPVSHQCPALLRFIQRTTEVLLPPAISLPINS